MILGSLGRECFPTATLTETVAAWNRSVAGGKSEDTTVEGYIARVGGVTICHTGDTVMYDGLVERIRDNMARGERFIYFPCR